LAADDIVAASGDVERAQPCVPCPGFAHTAWEKEKLFSLPCLAGQRNARGKTGAEGRFAATTVSTALKNHLGVVLQVCGVT